jgi:hypothetical protein
VLGACSKKPIDIVVFFFSRKEAKALVLLRKRRFDAQTSAELTKDGLDRWWHAPKKLDDD